MKIIRILGVMALFATLTVAFNAYAADGKGDSAAPQEQGWFCPWAGQGNMGPGYGGMMGYGQGKGYGPGGMMGYDQGNGYGPGGMMGYGRGYGAQNYNRSGKPVNMDQAKVLIEKYMDRTGNPNLKSGKVLDKDKYFEADITTKDGSPVNKIYVDKRTGWMRFEY
jgi:hypothetical protein